MPLLTAFASRASRLSKWPKWRQAPSPLALHGRNPGEAAPMETTMTGPDSGIDFEGATTGSGQPKAPVEWRFRS